MTTTALSPRAAPSLYSGILLALIVLALGLEASFLAGLAGGRGSIAPRPPAAGLIGTASFPRPCVTP